jgi:uncharacterized protein YbjT (DUF2867 family)
MILITGAGGTVGSEIAKQLTDAGVPFRAGFHTASKATANNAVVIDFNDPASLRAAMQGIEKVFLVSNGPNQIQMETNAVEAAKASGVQHIVKLSVIRANEDSYSFAHVHNAIEKVIEASGLKWTHLRPNGFMQNMHNYMIATIKDHGAFYSSTGDAKIAHVDVRDIATAAVKVLTQGGHDLRSYTLTGPEGLSYEEIAKKLSNAAGREIKYVNLEDVELKNALVATGAPAAYADAFIDLLRFYRTGAAATPTGDVSFVTGHAPRTFDDYARDHVSYSANSRE